VEDVKALPEEAGARGLGEKRKAEAGEAAGGRVALQISALKSRGGSFEWDDEVKSILLRAYGGVSGSIDTESKIAAIPCDVWQAMDASIRRDRPGSGLVWTYGFEPGMVWVDAFGIAEKMRATAFTKLKACGLPTG
jgi:hypothetical protein